MEIDKNDYDNTNMISGQLLLSVNVTNDLFISQQSHAKCMPKSSAMSSIICFFNKSDVLLECMKYTCIGNILCDFSLYMVNN